MANIVLVNPKFDISYFGMEHVLPFCGKKANMPTACLPLLAALTPQPHHVTLADENVRALDLDRIAHADIVGVTGMSVQRAHWRRHPWVWFRAQSWNAIRAAALFARLMWRVSDPALRAEYRRRVRAAWRVRRDADFRFVYVLKCAMHYHYYMLTQRILRQEAELINVI